MTYSYLDICKLAFASYITIPDEDDLETISEYGNGMTLEDCKTLLNYVERCSCVVYIKTRHNDSVMGYTKEVTISKVD